VKSVAFPKNIKIHRANTRKY